MAYDVMVQPGEWNELLGLWFKVDADPLAGPKRYRVSVHNDPVFLHCDQPNGGFRVQAVPPDTHDFASTDGEPL